MSHSHKSIIFLPDIDEDQVYPFTRNVLTCSFLLFRRCLYSQNKYGAPIRCEICQQNCAFDSPNHKVFINVDLLLK